MWFIILLLAAVAFYFLKNNKTVRCNIDSDISCKMYSQQDIQTKCTSLCLEKNNKYVFTGTHRQEGKEHLCECDYPEKFTLDFTNIGENPDILPDVIPTDVKFSDRNYLEKTEEKRYKDLIFGIAN